VAAPSEPEHSDVEAKGLVTAAPEDVFEFLTELPNHWLLASRFVEVVSLDGSDGGRVRLRGPLGLRRTVVTRVVAVRPHRLMIGTAEIGSRTRARVSWTLAGRLGDTRVRLAADIERAGLVDRLLLALGGRAWLRRRFAGTLDRVVEVFANAGTGGSDLTGRPRGRDTGREPSAAVD
jgi:hypothetical protein